MPGYRSDFPWDHGTVMCYKHKPCRCDPCKQANTLRMNHYRLGRRTFVYAKPAATIRVREHARWLCAPKPGEPKTGPTVAKIRWSRRTLSAHIGMDRRSLARFMTGEDYKILQRYAELILATPDRKFYLSLPQNPARKTA